MFTVPFNSIKTPKFIAQPTNVFFGTVKLSNVFMLLPASECAGIKSLSTVQRAKQCFAVVAIWEELLNI